MPPTILPTNTVHQYLEMTLRLPLKIKVSQDIFIFKSLERLKYATYKAGKKC